MRAAVRFCKARGYRRIFLWTTSELEAAGHIYQSFGFQKTGQKTHDIWGRKQETEERYELRL
jgi:GNAT superfamily N-acetyltransferase